MFCKMFRKFAQCSFPALQFSPFWYNVLIWEESDKNSSIEFPNDTSKNELFMLKSFEKLLHPRGLALNTVVPGLRQVYKFNKAWLFPF